MKETPAICFEDVSFRYGSKPVLKRANFDIFPGDYVSVVGPNGGGKTTLLKLALGLLRPNDGRIRVFGKDPREARGWLGYVPQQIHFDPAFPARALDVVLMGRVGRGSFGFASARDRRHAREALDQVGLGERAQVSFARLSGGQRQAVLIARALAGETRALLLDEPDAHIDPGGRENLLRLLDQLPVGITKVLVSHDMDLVASAVEKAICVDGEVHIHPTSSLTPERLRSVFGHDFRLVRHDQEHPEADHFHAHELPTDGGGH